MNLSEIKQPLILFDGYCNLCSSSVQFIIKRDKKKQYFFTSLQSEVGTKILEHFKINSTNLESVILLKKNKVYIESNAALLIAKNLSGFWPIFYSFIIIPPFIRNFIYQIIAKNRYHWFGQKEACWIPSKELLTRFL